MDVHYGLYYAANPHQPKPLLELIKGFLLLAAHANIPKGLEMELSRMMTFTLNSNDGYPSV
jgi:hypothetical protein